MQWVARLKVNEARFDSNDTDTNASMTGQLAGAGIGAAKIPNPMIELSPDKTYIQNIANEFANTVSDQSCDDLN